MDQVPQELLDELSLHDQVLEKAVVGLSDEQWLERLGPTNHAYWLLGHLVYCRRSLLRGTGLAVPPDDWEIAFGRGSQPSDTIDVPVETLLTAFLEAGRELRERLPNLPATELSSDSGRDFPTGTHVAGMIQFLAGYHESYHLGQLGLIAKALRTSGVA